MNGSLSAAGLTAQMHEKLGIPANIAWDGKTVVHYFEEAAGQFPNNRITLRGKLDATVTYRQALKDVRRLSSALQLDPFFRLKPGDHVGIHLPSTPQAAIAKIAVQRAGFVDIPIDPTWTDPKFLTEQLRRAEVKVLIVADFLLPMYLQIAEKLPNAPRILATHLSDYFPWWKRWLAIKGLKKAGRWHNIAAEMRRQPFVVRDWRRTLAEQKGIIGNCANPNGVSTLIFGSGSSGPDQKLIIWTHRNLAVHVRMMEAFFFNPADDPRTFKRGQERILAIMPLSHSFGATVCINAAVSFGFHIDFVPKPVKEEMQNGKLIRRFDPEAALAIMKRAKPTIVPLSPKHYLRLIEHLREQGYSKERPWDASSVKLCVSGSEKLSSTAWTEWKELTGTEIFEGYGLTEACAATHCSHPLMNIPGSVGILLSGITQKLVNDAGEEVAPGERGELWLAGESIFPGYLNQPAETLNMLYAEPVPPGADIADHLPLHSWLKTGDICIVSPENGTLKIVGRKKRVAIIGGVNVPEEGVEEVLRDHPLVEDAAALGVDLPEQGEILIAVVVLKNHERDANKETAEAIRDFCRNSGRLENVGVPKMVLFRKQSEIPLTGIGKVRSEMLRQMLREELSKRS